MNKKRYVLDSSALIAYFNKEKGWDVAEMVFNDVANNKAEIVMHKIDLTEVYYDELRSSGELVADNLFTAIKLLSISVDDDLTDQLIKSVGSFKVNNKVSLADCFALALAKKLNASLVTSDHHEFDIIEKTKAVKFKWIR